MRSFFRTWFFCRGHVAAAFALTTALSFVPGLITGSIHANNFRGAVSLACGALYAVLGMIHYEQLRIRGRTTGVVAYLCVQTILLGGILWFSRMVDCSYLAIFPLVVAMLVLLNRASATVAVIGIYLVASWCEAHFYGVQAMMRWSVPMIPSFIFVAIFTQIAVREKAARAQAENLAMQLEKLAVLQERNRLAREIHDGLGHFLTAIHVQLEGARTVHPADPARALDAVAQAQGLTRAALNEVRRSVGALKEEETSVVLADHLRELAAATEGWGAKVSFEILGSERQLSAEAKHALFRAGQEGLTNVRKHATAQHAILRVDFRQPDRVQLSVIDDGKGRGVGWGGHGLVGLRQRIAEFGGSINAANLPSGGFCLQVEIPA
jgi:signal transduction histidine kinase